MKTEKPQIDLAVTKKFLDALGCDCKCCFRTFTDGHNKRKALRGGSDPLARKLTGSLDEHQDELVKLNKQGAAIAVIVNKGGHDDASIIKVRALYADIDSAESAALAKPLCQVLKPHVVCHTSPQRWHLYWKVADCKVDDFKALQQAISKKINGDSVSNPSRAMRMPGFIHQKTSTKFLSRLRKTRDMEPYSVDQIVEGLGLSVANPKTTASSGSQVVTVNRNHHADLLELTRKTATLQVVLGLPTAPVKKLLIEVAKQRYVGREVGGDEATRAHVDAVKKIRAGTLASAEEVVDPREPVLILKGHESEATDAVERILVKRRSDLFIRGRHLVRLVTGPNEIAKVARVGDDWLVDAISRAARCEKLGKQGGREPMDCPKQIARSLIARAADLKFPRLLGIVHVPLLRPDGKVVTKPGYDKKTELLLDLAPDWPVIPKQLSKSDARKARKILFEPIRKYKFESREDRAVVYSAMLTTIVRAVLPSAPMHAASSPVAGAGKSKLMDICSILATGKPTAPMIWSPKNEEAEKRLGAALLEGSAMVCFDNVNAPLGGPLLCSVLTQQSAKMRVLGLSKVVDIPMSASLFANGINLVVSADATRRVLLSQVDPKQERPETQKFKFDPVIKATKQRVQLVNAALTIMSAYLQSEEAKDKSQGATPLGSFENWSHYVRDALIWAGAADPTKVMSRTRDIDPSTSNLRALLTAWKKAFGSSPKTAAEAVRASEMSNAKYEDLADILNLVAIGANGKVSPKSLGGYINQHIKKIVGDLKLVRITDAQGGIGRYKVASAKQKNGAAR